MARRVEIGTPTSCRGCPAAAIMLCEGSMLDSEVNRRVISDPQAVRGAFHGVVGDGLRFGCANGDVPKNMAKVLIGATLNGTRPTAKAVVEDYALVLQKRRKEPLPEGTDIQEVRTRLRDNLQRL